MCVAASISQCFHLNLILGHKNIEVIRSTHWFLYLLMLLAILKLSEIKLTWESGNPTEES